MNQVIAVLFIIWNIVGVIITVEACPAWNPPNLKKWAKMWLVSIVLGPFSFFVCGVLFFMSIYNKINLTDAIKNWINKD